jgi:hypothetical protein
MLKPPGQQTKQKSMYKKITLYTTICFALLTLQTHSQSVKPKTIAKGITVAYPKVDTLETSPDFAVKSNGTAIWTERVGNGDMENLNVANFECSGAQTITIKASENITKYAIKPKSAGTVGKVNGRELTFTINGPQKLYVEINELPHLAIFANPLEVKTAKKGDEGVVYYEPGFHNIGQIDLKSNQTIYIAAGAVVKANIRGTNVENVKILGRGMLNGNVRISLSKNIEVDGIFMRSTNGWANTLTECRHSVYNNVKIFTYRTVWGIDGIDPVSCKDFLINDCFIRTRDDCIAIKSSAGNARNPVKDINTDSITITNNLLVGWEHADGVTLGFELQGGVVQNILVKNCDILRARGQGRTGGHAAFGIVCDGPSMVKNIRFEDIRVEGEIEYKNLELIITEGRRYGTAGPGNIVGVYLKNIRWENTSKPFVIAGVPQNFVEDVTFDNCYLGGKLLTSMKDADFQTEFAKDIKFVRTPSSTKIKLINNKL